MRNLLALAAFLVLLGSYLAFRGGAPTTSAALSEENQLEPISAEVITPAELSEPSIPPKDSESGSSGSREAIATARTAAPPDLDIEAAVQALPTISIAGTVRVIERDGTESLDSTGSFRITLWSNGSGQSETVEYRQGRFETTIPSPQNLDSLSLWSLTRDEVALVTHSPTDHFQPSTQILVVGRVPDPSILKVVDSITGADLSGIELISADRVSRENGDHAGFRLEDRRVANGLQSPIELERWSEELRRTFHVGAAGYAWKRVEFNFREGGEKYVELQPAGTITVDFSGVDPAADSKLRLRLEGNSRPIASCDLEEDGSREFAGLPPGDYEVQAEVGKYYGSPVVLGSSNVALAAGEHARVVLTLSPPPVLERTRMGGAVHVPEEWEFSGRSLSIELLDTPLGGFDDRVSATLKRIPAVREGYDSFLFTRKEMQVGRYKLTLDQPFFNVAVELPIAGREDIELVIPPPAELLVHVVDKASGAPVQVKQLHWNPKRPRGSGGGTLESAPYDAERGAYVVIAPEGEIALSPSTDEYRFLTEIVDLRLGLREHTLELERACGFSIELKAGNAMVSFPDRWRPRVTAESGKGWNVGSRYNSKKHTIFLSEAGSYLVEFPEIAGYREIPAQTLEVPPHTIVEHVVQLEKK